MSAQPYGPNTAGVRRFLVQLAGLGKEDRGLVVARYAQARTTVSWRAAEQHLATAIARSGREPQRDALTGPLLQLVRPVNAPAPATDDDALALLDPVAEPALAALLALLVEELLPPEAVETLSAPFAGVIARR
ncbi:hypothetical protein [Gemmatimonas sp.]|uniref:hypothetical protein n=1 Tax=Gemmatimonas sp. TaxID=1962908 RepID=UPI0022C50A71|nr:hypothetical protein [Gemmatimonas sp.]MCA2993276.1 hypothetical protein [Gemmatimonas sp.]MCE2952751.1 hypothetical protein [Gemmatimonas sp.]MCZ8011963.1 hypothetical protein [Gemmatimonas sp.]MCZ8267281.1 hypothetical protein [Gemmatimonas sp.]